MLRSRRDLYLILAVTTVAIALAQLGAYYILERTDAQSKSSTILCGQATNYSSGQSTIIVNLLINYGNGTMTWDNQTTVPSSWNAYALTMYVTKCNVEAEYYGPPLNEHFVKSINGLVGEGQLSWSIWTFCQNEDAWSYSHLGADLIQLSNGEILAWVYGPSSSTSPPSPPVLGAKTVNSCT
ncbi:hypothetical protein J2P12_01560 [Candidatus Bathyarchaeota archaeon]|nr:hypothetical protein [Candidatus Bathyarchaeota archaeon]